MSRTTYICPKCGKPGNPDTVTRRNAKGELLRKESYCLHFDHSKKTKSGYPKSTRCRLGVIQSAEALGLDFLNE